MSIDLITLRDPQAPASEAYRTLRTTLQFSRLERPLHTLLVTSSAANEGKSTLLANLAVTLAQVEQRVIVVDCDLRRPTLHSIFGVDNERGLSVALDTAPGSPLPLQDTSVPGLRVLPAGPATERPADLIGSRRIDALIARLISEADLVLFDAPPIVMFTDAVVLATKVDGVVLATSSGKTRRDHARDAVQILQKVNATILGAVLTNAHLERGAHRAYR